MKPKVYFINFRTTPKENILKKLKRLVITAGIEKLDFKKKLVAIKIHFGEPGNLAYIRPNFVSVITQIIKDKEGLPFLTDTNTLYKGKRSNAVDHINSALINGFGPMTTGCNVVIADGIKGTDYREIEINQKHFKKAKIATALVEADVIISMNHFKGHEMTSFGGCLKNLGMGGGAVGGKLEMHSDSQPLVNKDSCISCNLCVENCAHDAINLNEEDKATINYKLCVGCGQCIAVCQYGATQAKLDSPFIQEKIAEYALATIKDKPTFHISFLMNISPHCDCWGFNDSPIVGDIGILASSDPVALDKASVDLVNIVPINPNSIIGEHEDSDEDRFKLVFPKLDWKTGVNYAEQIGLGTQDYELVEC